MIVPGAIMLKRRLVFKLVPESISKILHIFAHFSYLKLYLFLYNFNRILYNLKMKFLSFLPVAKPKNIKFLSSVPGTLYKIRSDLRPKIAIFRVLFRHPNMNNSIRHTEKLSRVYGIIILN